MAELVPTINVTTLSQWLDKAEATLIDVREEHEFAVGAINGAILVPLSKFTSHNIPLIGGKKIVFQCRSGKRSEHACFLFLQEFPEIEAYNLEGGILAWQAKNFPILTP